MSRLVLLLALGGCDLAFGLVRDTPPPVCGPFGPPSEVTIELGPTAKAHDLSVDASGMRGMVQATLKSGALTWTGPHAVVQSAPNMWVTDPARDKPVLNGLDGGHLVYDGTVFGWIDRINTVRTPELHQYAFTTAWSPISGSVTMDLSVSTHVGNAIELPVAMGAVQKFLVEISIEELPPNNLAIYELPPGAGTDWQRTGQAAPLLEATSPVIDPQMGLLTSDHEILVYAAKLGTETVTRLFATRRARNLFQPGVELIIEGFAADSDFTEPWINADCTQLYFRQGDTTWMTTAVDDAASRR